MWTPAEVKAADAALGIADPGAAAAALNGQTVTVIGDVATGDARAIILQSGEWFKIKKLAAMALTGTATDQAIAAADICVDTLTLTETIRASDPTVWAAVQQMGGALVTAGVLSQASLNAWGALRTRMVPKWSPAVTAGDVQTARSQP